MKYSRSPFTLIKDHVLLPVASQLVEADMLLKNRFSPAHIEEIINAIPDTWLGTDPLFANYAERRAAYIAFLVDRLASSHIFVEEALHAREQLV